MTADDAWSALRAHGTEATNLAGLIASVTARNGSVVASAWHLLARIRRQPRHS